MENQQQPEISPEMVPNETLETHSMAYVLMNGQLDMLTAVTTLSSALNSANVSPEIQEKVNLIKQIASEAEQMYATKQADLIAETKQDLRTKQAHLDNYINSERALGHISADEVQELTTRQCDNFIQLCDRLPKAQFKIGVSSYCGHFIYLSTPTTNMQQENAEETDEVEEEDSSEVP